MRRCFFNAFVVCVISLLVPMVAQAERYVACDACGLCRDTTKSNAHSQWTPGGDGKVIYIQPARWGACFKCLYPLLNPTPPPPPPPAVSCGVDQFNNEVEFRNINGVRILPGDPNFRCDTLLMDTYNPDLVNSPLNKPQSGRMFSDLGCISVNTSTGTFSDPNASVDVIQKLLNLVISATGAIGTILVMASAVRLILSKGDPEKIREGKKTLTNVVLGLLFALFGLLIFRFFAAQVLRIPGFN